MKEMKVVLAGLMLAALSLFAQSEEGEVLNIQGEWSELGFTRVGALPKGWRLNSKRNEGKAEWRETTEGKALEMSGNSDGADPFHLYLRDAFAISEGMVVEGRVRAEGGGVFVVLAYLYDAEGNNIGATAEAELKPEVGVFSDLPYSLEIPHVTKGKVAMAKLAVGVPSGGRVQIQTISAYAKTSHAP